MTLRVGSSTRQTTAGTTVEVYHDGFSYEYNVLRSILMWADTQEGVPTPYPHERIQSHRDSPALLFTTHPWRVSSCCLCEQHGSFINRGVEGWAGGSLTSCPRPPFAPPQRAPRSVLDQKKTVARLLTKNTHIAMGTAVERQLTWATIDYLRPCSVMANVRRKPSPV